ncbi:MAG: sugar phosphate isomerase/epimerase, partial [Planctomycetales bacterium]|nr:sugar phosphate isomerase/epimerase [Planctomycetales bacterium]
MSPSSPSQPPLAAFPKAELESLCTPGGMRLSTWIEQAATLDIDGLELYSGIIDLQEPAKWDEARKQAEQCRLKVPMLCCSPDFTHPDPEFRRRQVELEKGWIDMAVGLGASFCRVLSGQRRPEVTREDGLRFAAEAIDQCAQHAAGRLTLVIENHYKDNFWEHPEFAQKNDVFCELVDRVAAANFGVNYDPSNAFLAGEDPLELLRRVKTRVVTMHAS